MAKKYFVDSLIVRYAIEATSESEVLRNLQELIAEGNTLVCTEASSIDCAVFRHNIAWFEHELREGKIIVEIYQGEPGNTESGINAMINKPFVWSSYGGKTTDWHGTFESLAETMPESDELLKLYRTVVKYALPKGKWHMGPWHKADFFTSEQLTELGIDAKAAGNRSLVHEAMEYRGYPKAEYVRYTEEYLKGLVDQHHSDEIALLEYLA